MNDIGTYIKVIVGELSEVHLIIAHKYSDVCLTYIPNSIIFPDENGHFCSESDIKEYNISRKYLKKRIFSINKHFMSYSSKRNCSDCKPWVRC